MYCSNCGNRINESEKFCSNCGAPIKIENNIPEIVDTNQINTQPVNPVQANQTPVNTQPVGENQTPTNNTKGKSKLIYIIIIIITVALAGALIYVLKNKSTEETPNDNINEYETNEIETTNENSIINPTTPSTDTTNSTVYKYKGFSFKKQTGFTYEEEDELVIYSDNYQINLDVTQVSYEAAKTQHYNEITKSLESFGYTVSNLQTKTYSGKEYITCELTYNGKKGLYFITKANNNYIFEGIIANKNYTINYSNLDIVNNILKDATYVGSYSDYSTSFSKNINIGE